MDIAIKSIVFLTNIVVPKFYMIVQLSLALLVIWIVWKKSDNKINGINKRVRQSIFEKWNPKSIVDCNTDDDSSDYDTRIVDGKVSKYVYVNGCECIDLATYNFLGLMQNINSKEVAVDAIKKYGVGSCGPRGFYGTVDVHIQLENEIAKFLNVEEAIIYSYGFSTLASAIPAYAKSSDFIFADCHVNFSIQQGLIASRSKVMYFDHNDLKHLEVLLKEQIATDGENIAKASKSRKFLIVEGIYLKSGDICPLPGLLELKKKYKLRLFIDESLSIGTLGATGRGITEHFNIPVKDVDLIMGSMEFCLCSVGGFCAGSSFIIEHQRISGLGYCFSASLPPALTVVALKNLQIIKENPHLIKQLRHNCEELHYALLSSDRITTNMVLAGNPICPIKLLFPGSTVLVDKFIEYCMHNGVAVSACLYLPEEKPPCKLGIRLSVSALIHQKDIEKTIKVLETALLEDCVFDE